MSVSSLVFDKISGMMEDIEVRGGEMIVLNDPALVLYGLTKPINELRILVGGDIDETVYHIVEHLGMKPYMKDVLKSIRTIGLAVLNPVTLPITIIETPRLSIDRKMLEEYERIQILKYVLNIPKLEDLIVKMLILGKYPYTAYAYTLLLANLDEVNYERLREGLKENNINIRILAENIRRIRDLAIVFPELGSIESNKIDKLLGETL